MVFVLIKFLIKGEVLFAGFLFSSVFKANFDFVPIDLTLLFMVLTLFVAVKRLLERPVILKIAIAPIVTYILISSLMLVSLIYTSGSGYAVEKTLAFSTVTFWSFAGIFLLIKSNESLRMFIRGLLFYGLLTISIVFLNYLFGNSGDISRVGVGSEGTSNVLGLGRLTGITIIILASSLVYSKHKFTKKLFLFSAIVTSLFVLVLTGSRMPFLALVPSLILMVLFSIDWAKGIRIRKGLLLSLPLIPVVYFVVRPIIQGSNVFYRLNQFFETAGGGQSVQSRADMIKGSINMWKGAPIFGEGIGSFPVYYASLDYKNRLYPHNIFTEFLSELGLIGLLLFLFLIIISVISVIKSKKDGNQITVVLIGFYLIINANSTGDFNDNRWLFSFMALMIMMPLYEKNTYCGKEGGYYKNKLCS